MIELLVVIAIIAILAGMILPTLGKAKGKAQSLGCLNNEKHLQLAWQMYQDDNNDKLAPNHLLSGVTGPLLPGSWAVGNAFADTSDLGIRQGVLFTYTGAPSVYRCASDKSTVNDKKGGQPRTRHYSMSCYMNGKCPDSLLVTSPYSRDDWVFHTGAQMASAKLAPSDAFVFIHEADFTVNFGGGWFYLPLRWTWANFPANHENGQNLSFADGHAEHWLWKDPGTLKTFKSRVDSGNGFLAKDNRDLARLLKATPGWWEAAATPPGARPGQGGPDVFP